MFKSDLHANWYELMQRKYKHARKHCAEDRK